MEALAISYSKYSMEDYFPNQAILSLMKYMIQTTNIRFKEAIG